MIPIAVYKRYFEDNPGTSGQFKGDGGSREDRNSKKPYVWLHPPKHIDLSNHDELFVLCDKNPKDSNINEGLKGRANMDFN
jgi:hypothetical protein